MTRRTITTDARGRRWLLVTVTAEAHGLLETEFLALRAFNEGGTDSIASHVLKSAIPVLLERGLLVEAPGLDEIHSPPPLTLGTTYVVTEKGDTVIRSVGTFKRPLRRWSWSSRLKPLELVILVVLSGVVAVVASDLLGPKLGAALTIAYVAGIVALDSLERLSR